MLAHAPVAVGTGIAPRPPRTDPDVRLSRIRLLPRVRDGKPLVGPWMKDARPGKPVIREHGDAGPGQASLLSTAATLNESLPGHIARRWRAKPTKVKQDVGWVERRNRTYVRIQSETHPTARRTAGA